MDHSLFLKGGAEVEKVWDCFNMTHRSPFLKRSAADV
jgi:hypothetical protein